MTSAEAQNQLQEVSRNLDTAVECLVETPWRVPEIHRQLGATAAALKRLYEHRAGIRSRASVIPAIRKIQKRLAEVRLLLDAAATFYCGAIYGALASGGAYSADGEMTRVAH